MAVSRGHASMKTFPLPRLQLGRPWATIQPFFPANHDHPSCQLLSIQPAAEPEITNLHVHGGAVWMVSGAPALMTLVLQAWPPREPVWLLNHVLGYSLIAPRPLLHTRRASPSSWTPLMASTAEVSRSGTRASLCLLAKGSISCAHCTCTCNPSPQLSLPPSCPAVLPLQLDRRPCDVSCVPHRRCAQGPRHQQM